MQHFKDKPTISINDNTYDVTLSNNKYIVVLSDNGYTIRVCLDLDWLELFTIVVDNDNKYVVDNDGNYVVI